MKESDRQLLQRYLKEGSGGAFRAIVERHLTLVHSAAFRVTGNAEAARDVSQLVFLKLSRRSSLLPAGLPLPAWLHREAHGISVDHIRSEVRRQRREQLAVEISTMKAEPELWKGIEPVIDGAVDSLAEKDRSVVLLRFYQGHTHPEIAQELGISEDAARMRTNRSLEKLRGILGKRGITASSALLSATLPAHAMAVPPAGLSASIAAATAASSSTTILASLILMTKSNMLAITVILLAVPVIGFLQYQVSTLEKENVVLRANRENSGEKSESRKVDFSKNRSEFRKRKASRRISKKVSGTQDARVIVDHVFRMRATGLGPAHPSLQAMIHALGEVSPEGLFSKCREIEDPMKRNVLASCVINMLAETEPLECLALTKEMSVKKQPDMAGVVLRAWVKKSPKAATDWFLANELAEDPLLGSAQKRDDFGQQIANGLARADLVDEALVFAGELNGKRRKKAAVSGILNGLKTEDLPTFGGAVLAQVDDDSVKTMVFEGIAGRIAGPDVEKGKTWAEALNVEDTAIAQAATDGVARSWMKVAPSEAADWWLKNSHPEKTEEVYTSIVESWAESAPNQCGAWLVERPEEARLNGARAAFARAINERDPETAQAWIQAIDDENLQEVVRRELNSE